MDHCRALALVLISVTWASSPCWAEGGPNEWHVGPSVNRGSSAPPPSPAGSPRATVPIGFPSVEQVLQEVAAQTIEQLEQRFRDLIRQYGIQGRLLIESTIDRLLRRNLSAKEMALLTTVLELAADEQIQEAARGAWNNRSFAAGPWSRLGQTIAIKLAQKKWGDLTPELKALKVLADQTSEILQLTPKAREEFRGAQRKFKEALVLLGDRKVDGQGMLKLAAASGALMKASFREFGRDLRLALQPQRVEKTMDAALLLANSIANTDPASKAILRPILARELEIDRVQVKPDGTLDWKATAQQIATFDANDARVATRILETHQMISAAEAQAVERAIRHTEAAHQTYQQLVAYVRSQSSGPPKDFQSQVTQVQQLAYDLNQRGQIGDDLALEVQRVAAAFGALSAAREAGRMIHEDLQNPIVRRRLGLDPLLSQRESLRR